MSIIDKNLLPDEQIIYRTKKHFIIFVIPLALTTATVALFFNENMFLNRLAFLPALVGLFSWATQLLSYWSSEFVITNKRISMREGFFFRHANETRLATIANTSVDQNLLGQLLDYGSIIIHPFGGNTDPFTEIPSPNAFQRELQMQLDKITANALSEFRG